MESGKWATDAQGKLDWTKINFYDFQKRYYPNYKYADKVLMIYSPKYIEVKGLDPLTTNAVTTEKLYNGKYLIAFGEPAMANELKLFSTMGHEFVHVGHYVTIPRGLMSWESYKNASEWAAYNWEGNVNYYNTDNKSAYFKSRASELFNEGNDYLSKFSSNQLQNEIKTQFSYKAFGLPTSMDYSSLFW